MFRKNCMVILLGGVAFAISVVESDACCRRRSRSCCQPSQACVVVDSSFTGSGTGTGTGTNTGTGTGTSAAEDKMFKEIADFLEYKGKDLEDLKEAWKTMDAPARKKLHDSIQLPPDETSSPAEFVVNLPADATLTIDGQKTTSTSGQRFFHRSPLPAGIHTYKFVAEIVRNGETLRVSRSIEVRSGHVIQVVDLRFPANELVTTR